MFRNSGYGGDELIMRRLTAVCGVVSIFHLIVDFEKILDQFEIEFEGNTTIQPGFECGR